MASLLPTLSKLKIGEKSFTLKIENKTIVTLICVNKPHN